MSSPNCLSYRDISDIHKLSKLYNQHLEGKNFLYYVFSNENYKEYEIEFHSAKFLHLVGLKIKNPTSLSMQNGLKPNATNIYNTLKSSNQPPRWVLQYLELSHDVSYKEETGLTPYDDFIEKKDSCFQIFSKMSRATNICNIEKSGCLAFIHWQNTMYNIGISDNNYNNKFYCPKSNYHYDFDSDKNVVKDEILFTGIKNPSISNDVEIINFSTNITTELLNKFNCDFIKNENYHFDNKILNQAKNISINNSSIIKQQKTDIKISNFVKKIKRTNPDKANFYKQVFDIDRNVSFKTFINSAEEMWQQELEQRKAMTPNFPQIDFQKFYNQIGIVDDIPVWADKDIDIRPYQEEIEDLYEECYKEIIDIDPDDCDISLYLIDTSTTPHSFMAARGTDIFYKQDLKSVTLKTKSSNSVKNKIKASIQPTKSQTKFNPTIGGR